MKVKNKIFLGAVSVFFAMFFGIFSTFAVNGEVYSRNIERINAKSEFLNMLMDGYAQKDLSADKKIAVFVNSKVVEYYNKINNLRGDSRVGTENLQDEIDLICSKGQVIGECSFVYVSHIDSLFENSKKSVDEQYRAICFQIESYTDANALLNNMKPFIKKMYVCIYTEKISMLCLENTSPEIAVIYAETVEKIQNVGLNSLDGKTFEEIYENASKEIVVQKDREQAQKNFAFAYDKIYGVGSYEKNVGSDRNIAGFLYKIKSCTKAKEFNYSIKDGLFAVLDSKTGKINGEYTNAFIQNIKKLIESEIMEADVEGKIAKADNVLQNFENQLISSNSKDELCDYAKKELPNSNSEKINIILDEYVKIGGTFDLCKDKTELQNLLEKGKIRIDLLKKYGEFLQKSEKLYGNFDFLLSKSKAEELYFSSDKNVKSSVTLEGARGAYRNFLSDADALFVEFEKDVYCKKYGGLADKKAEISDKSTLKEAILAYGELSQKAKLDIAKLYEKIAKNYKEVCNFYLDSLVLGNLINEKQTEIGKYKSVILLLCINNQTEFVSQSENIMLKAENSLEILKIYENALNFYSYDKFSDFRKADIKSKKDSYLKELSDLNLSASKEEIKRVSDSAELEICRSVSFGMIESLKGENDSETVTSILKNGCEKLIFADSVSELERCRTLTELEVTKQRYAEALDLNYEFYLEEIKSLQYIKENMLNGFIKDFTQKLGYSKSEIFKATDVTNAQKKFIYSKEEFTLIFNAAKKANMNEAAAKYSALMDEYSIISKKKTEEFEYLTLSRKKEISEKLTVCLEKKKSEIEKLAEGFDTEKMKSVYFDFKAFCDFVCDSAEAENTNEAKKFYKNLVDGKTDSFCHKVNKLEFISSDGKTVFVKKAVSYLQNSKNLLDGAKNIPEINNIYDMFCANLTALEKSSEKENFSFAKLSYKLKIQNNSSSARAYINTLNYISDSEKENILNYLSSFELSCSEKIDTASDLNGIYAVFESYEMNKSSILKDAESKNLSGIKKIAYEEIKSIKEKCVESLKNYGYLKVRDKEIFSIKAAEIETKLKKSTDNAENVESAEKILIEIKKSFEILRGEISDCNTENARSEFIKIIEDKFSSFDKKDFEESKYETLKIAYSSALESIKSAESIEKFKEITNSCYEEMLSVNSIFDDAKEDALGLINNSFEKIKKEKERFSKENFDKISDIFARTESEIKASKKEFGAREILDFAKLRISMMEEIKADYVSSGGLDINFDRHMTYPSGYDCKYSGIFGIILGSEGIDFDTKLEISFKNAENFHIDAVKKAIKERKMSFIRSSFASEKELAHAVKKMEVVGIFDIRMLKENAVYDSFLGTYTVKILLPQELLGSKNLSLVYLDEGGRGEFYGAKIDGSFLIFETSHFSNFYLLANKKANLVTLTVFLSLAGIFECGGIVYLKLKNSRKDKVLLASVAPFYMFGFLFEPVDFAVCILLFLLDVLLAFYLIKLLKEAKKEKAIIEEAVKKEKISFKRDYFSECVDDLKNGNGFEESKENTAKNNEEIKQESEQEAKEEKESQSKKATVWKSVNANDADRIVSNSSISKILLVSKKGGCVDKNCKRAYINVDTLSENFNCGDVVTLKKLTEKKLVPEGTKYLKILARGSIDKPLTVVAQSFSDNAIKMIALTGGKAILEGNS